MNGMFILLSLSPIAFVFSRQRRCFPCCPVTFFFSLMTEAAHTSFPNEVFCATLAYRPAEQILLRRETAIFASDP